MKMENKNKQKTFLKSKKTMILCLVTLFIFMCVGVGLIHWLNNNQASQTKVNVASGAPTNSDSWNDEGNYSTTAPQGSGTSDDPYLISTAEELAWISVNYSGDANAKYYLQTADIDLGAHYWVPINNSSSRYTYYYDGNNHVIRNLYIDAELQGLSSSSYLGIFGNIQDSYIRNLGVVGGSVKGGSSIGAIVGRGQYLETRNCFNQGVSIISSGGSSGGIIGVNAYGSVTNCYNTGSVNGEGNSIGGIAGTNSWGTVSECYNSADVIGVDNTGGVVGSSSSTRNCYNTGSVSGGNRVGGVVGNIAGNASGGATLSNNYNTGSISGNSYVGGVAGYNASSNLTSNYNYYNNSTGNTNSYGSATGVSYSNMLVTASGVVPSSMSNLTNGVADDTWRFIVGKTPLLTGVGEGDLRIWDGTSTEAPTLQDPSAANSETNPYIIDTAAKLAWISANYNQSNCYGQHYLQTENLDLADHPWTPINNVADTTTGNRRAYYYDGGNHTISNLYINTAEQTLTSNDYLGLFGYVRGSFSNHCYIKNLGIVNGSIAGEDSHQVGAVVGYSYYTDITNCYNEKTDITITGSSQSVGGVAGYNVLGTIRGSYNTGAVSGNSNVGGVAGYNSGTISGSYNTGAVSGSYYVGGVVGYNNSGTINSSYNTSEVSGVRYVGGVVGDNSGGTISGSYNDGDITGTSNYVGGVVGLNSSGTISGSYNTGTVSGDSSNWVGGVAGYNDSGTISSSYNTGTVSGVERVGGVAGYNDSGTISSSYNTGAVSGSSSVGGVVGNNERGTISSSYNIGAVSGDDSAGGVAGDNYYGTISGSYNDGDITGSSNSVGGVVGYNDDGTISNSYNIGTVSGSERVGGVVGYNYNGTTISNSYNTGDVTGESQVGGVAGYVQGSSSSRSVISSCYSTGAVIRSSGSEASFGGVFGYVPNSRYVSISWCYYNEETSGSVVTSAIGRGNGYQCYGLTTTEMQGAQNENYMYLSSTYWNFASGQYPTLKYVAKPAQN